MCWPPKIDGSIVSVAAEEGLPCHQDCNSREGKISRYSGPALPEDILLHIHSLLPLRDAARAASVSRAFRNSWKCHPNLYFSNETMGLKDTLHGPEQMQLDFISTVYHILKRHSGTGLKTFGLEISSHYDPCHLDSWLHLALSSGLEELIIELCSGLKMWSGMCMPWYNFPCSLLSGKSRDSIQNLRLSSCAFHPTVRFCLRSLKKLYLCSVSSTDDELQCILSDSFALERLELLSCSKIINLKIPYLLQRLSYLEVKACLSLEAIQIEAPNISTFRFSRRNPVQLSLGEACQVKDLYVSHYGAVYFARVDLPLIAPCLEILTIESHKEMVNNITILPSKFYQLKYLDICVPGQYFVPDYDFFSLASFLDASPSLETFILDFNLRRVFADPESVLGELSQSHMRQTAEHHYGNLKRVKINRFHPARSLVELTCHILESAASLQCLTLDTKCCCSGVSHSKSGKCFIFAVRAYIEGNFPSTTRLDFPKPCTLDVKLSLPSNV
ncbi:hypothetical protein SORBI_3002G254600 [Sorghum bicolor]|uniref:F-box domain-containing protein n=1 Tax=Sorghum bicolor TaxID=4558 RepID=A0A1W0W5P6_SORBI|nr:hypothetical protein SORBI_3002G254600 [Sorghum bicolor]